MKRLKTVWFITILLITAQIHAIQYLYPVGALDQTVYCVYQSSSEIISLVIWDHERNEILPGLLSRYMPAGFRLLPNNASYSFLDNGILRIKEFAKRSPKSLEFYTPIYDISVPGWIDASTGYFAAKVRDSFGIFHFDIDANCACLLLDPKKDFLYPQKIESSLFYIERVKRGLGYQFRIMNIQYPENVEMSNDDDDQIAFSPVLNAHQATEIIDFHDEPIAFLTMHDNQTGYLISYPAHIDEEAPHIACSYYMLSNRNGWQERRLFDFVIPTSLLFKSSSERLYESILPLLPRHIDNDIYFADASASEHLSLNLFVYHPLDGSIEQITHADEPGVHYFAPIKIGGSLYCGGSLIRSLALIDYSPQGENELHYIK